MISIEKKPITTTNKALLWLAGIEMVVIVMLFLSGFKQINAYLLVFVITVTVLVLFYFLRMPKEKDLFEIVELISNKYYKKTKKFLDTSDFFGVPVTNDVMHVFFPNEGLTFEIRNKRVMGLHLRHIYKVVKEQERSRLFELGMKYVGVEAKLRQQAEAINIDKESIGLE